MTTYPRKCDPDKHQFSVTLTLSLVSNPNPAVTLFGWLCMHAAIRYPETNRILPEALNIA